MRDDIQVDGFFIPAIEYGPEFAFGPEEETEGEWDAYRRLVKEIKKEKEESMGRLWAVISDSDVLLAYEEAQSEEEAVLAFFAKAGIPDRWLYAVPGEKVRGDVWVPRWLVDALDDPEALGTPESAPEAWDDFWAGVAKLELRGIRLANIAGWVKVKDRDFWVPVVR